MERLKSFSSMQEKPQTYKLSRNAVINSTNERGDPLLGTAITASSLLGCDATSSTSHRDILMIRIKDKRSLLVPSEWKILFLTVWESFKWSLQTPGGLSGVFYRGQAFIGHSAIKSRWLTFWNFLPSAKAQPETTGFVNILVWHKYRMRRC